MQKQSGFTLFELMIAIMIIAILAALGIPAYYRHIQKAAMTNILPIAATYKAAVELCILETGAVDKCDNDSYGIPEAQTNQYIENSSVSKGVITLTGKNTLVGLTVKLSPKISTKYGGVTWERKCTASKNNSLKSACEDVIKEN